jgi:hypothetical protein
MEPPRTLVTFDSDLADDGQWDDQGNRTAPAGLPIAKFFQESLTSAGIHAEEPDNHEDYAWDLRCRVDKAIVWVMVGEAERWLVTVELHPWLLNPIRWRSGPEALRGVCEAIDQSLKRDPRFRDIQWFTKAEFDAIPGGSGASSP